MRIDYYTDETGFLWAVFQNDDGTYTHYFLGTKDRENRMINFYNNLAKKSAA